MFQPIGPKLHPSSLHYFIPTPHTQAPTENGGEEKDLQLQALTSLANPSPCSKLKKNPLVSISFFFSNSFSIQFQKFPKPNVGNVLVFELRFKLIWVVIEERLILHLLSSFFLFDFVKRWDFYLTSMTIIIFGCWVWIPNTYSCAFSLDLDWFCEYSKFWVFKSNLCEILLWMFDHAFSYAPRSI